MGKFRKQKAFYLESIKIEKENSANIQSRETPEKQVLKESRSENKNKLNARVLNRSKIMNDDECFSI